MKYSTRLLSLTLCLCLLCALLPPVMTGAVSVADLTYSIADGKVTVTGCNSTASGDLVIPDTVEGYPVTAIRYSAFAHCTKLTSVAVPDSVTDIGREAFYYCTGLTAVTLGDSVAKIGDFAFWYCTGLTDITIPNSVTHIGQRTFAYCNRLTEVTVPDSVTHIGAGAFSGCKRLKGIRVSDGHPAYQSDAFGVLLNKSGTELIQAPGGISGSYRIPEGVTAIGDYAFDFCADLTEVTVPEGVTAIGEYAFYHCDSLTGVILPNSLTGIGESAFYYCTGITEVTVPHSVTAIGGWAFAHCDRLTKVKIGGSVTEIGDDAFAICNRLQDICFTGDTPSLGDNVFGGSIHATLRYHAGLPGWEAVTSEQLTGGEGTVTLQAVDHFFTEYIYADDHTCTADGTEQAVCLTCGKIDARKVEGTAAHRYADGLCSLCGLKENHGFLVGGLTTYAQGAAVLELRAAGETVWSREFGDGAYETQQVPTGAYTLTVSKPGHTTRTYTVTVEEGENVLSLKLHLKGDITGDGRQNVGDVARLYAHARKTDLLTDYLLLVADLTGEGRVNVGDVSRLYAHARKTDLLPE